MNTAAAPGLLETMIADYPGTAEQKEKASAAALDYTVRHGPPPYSDIRLCLGFFKAVFQAARAGEE
jgi:hypothetical protein